ncbi:MAG: ABC transporter ATP-binding protein [Gammaproteobacteria bacterium]
MQTARRYADLPPLAWPPGNLAPALPLTPVHADPVPPPLLSLRGVAKTWGRDAARVPVLEDIELDVRDGEFLAVVGYSGSGKTTLLSLLAGLSPPDAGTITKRGRALGGPGPDRGVVFQRYALLPWATVAENVALAVDAAFRREPRAARAARVAHYVELVGLAAARDRRPAELSGGMRQRVAVARALAADPDVLLLDEPLSALDALTRAKLQDEIVRLWAAARKTVVLVTNDVDEALMLADRIVPLTVGPRATLGPSFAVTLPRPRDRSALNHDADFRALRRELTAWLLDAGRARAQAAAGVPALPALRPATARVHAPPGALHRERAAGDARYVELTQVSKAYPGRDGAVPVVENFDLRIARGEFVSLIGHSGCGKSTVLALLAGLTASSGGGIVLDHREVDAPGPDRGLVFQSPSLVPWLSALDNVMLGVRRVFPQASARERRAICEHYLARVGLGDALHARATELSTGMQQRVGIARAFALQPKLLLLDEPFGMLDALTRWELQEVLMDVWSSRRLTTLCVTHDVDEAILLADRVVMMTNGPRARVGRILEVALPRPRTRRALLEHPDYWRLREALLSFLADGAHGAAA